MVGRLCAQDADHSVVHWKRTPEMMSQGTVQRKTAVAERVAEVLTKMAAAHKSPPGTVETRAYRLISCARS